MRNAYHEELNDLIRALLEMGEAVTKRLRDSTSVLSEDTTVPAKELIRDGRHIITLEREISNKAIKLINNQQPVASDLRTIISIIKVSYDLLRISENIDNFGETRKRIKITNEKIRVMLHTMESLAILMLKDVRTAYENKDTDLLKEIYERDSDIDALFVQITTTDIFEISDAFVTGQSQLAAKYAERIGDHIKNIAEHVYYVITAENLSQ